MARRAKVFRPAGVQAGIDGEAVRRARAEGASVAALAARFGVSHGTISYHLRQGRAEQTKAAKTALRSAISAAHRVLRDWHRRAAMRQPNPIRLRHGPPRLSLKVLDPELRALIDAALAARGGQGEAR